MSEGAVVERKVGEQSSLLVCAVCLDKGTLASDMTDIFALRLLDLSLQTIFMTANLHRDTPSRAQLLSDSEIEILPGACLGD